MLIAIVIGAVLGMFNGFFVSFLRLPAMIVTLGTASVFKRASCRGTLESKQLAVIPAGMKAFGKQAIYTATNPVGGLSSKLPAAFLVFVGVLLLTFLVLRYTMFGRGHLRHWRQLNLQPITRASPSSGQSSCCTCLQA